MYRLLHYALRQLRQSPGFAATAILTLAIGIGAPAAIFAVLDAVLLNPLPFAQPDRLVAVDAQPDATLSIPTMLDYQSRSNTFVGLAAYRQWSPAQKADGAIAAHRVIIVSQGFFSTLGTRPALGTTWPITGNEKGCTAQAVVSGAYWNRLGGGRTLGSRKLNFDHRDFQISGVLPVEQAIEGMFALNEPEVFLPIGCDSDERPTNRGSDDFQVIGRLREGVTLAQANADLARVDATLQKDYPNDYTDYHAAYRKPTLVYPYVTLLVGASNRAALLLTFAACGLLLVIACANLANLMLARNTRRRSEFATRATLGATPGQLLRQLLTESAVLVAMGAAGGILVAQLILSVMKSTTVLHLPRLAHAGLHAPVLAFVFAVTATVTCLLALLPAWRTLRPGLLQDMQGTARSSAARGMRLTGRLLIVAQLTFTVVLIACAGWMIGGVYMLLHQPLGFLPEHLLMMEATVRSGHATKDAALQAEQILTQMTLSLRQLPGVASVALADHVPLGHAINRYTFCTDVHSEQCAQQVNINPNSYAISSSYFRTIGQPLLEGRDFNAADDGRNNVVIVNQVLAAREWPGQSALGHRVHTGEIADNPGRSWATVVGVVGNVHSYDLQTAPGPDLYLPRSEDPNDFSWLLLRVEGDPAAWKHSAKVLLQTGFAQADVYHIETMHEEMEHEVLERAFLMRVGMAFAAIALFLSVLGTYGLLAYEVSLREKEIGIRLALGSSRERVVRLLLQQEGRWLVLGSLSGLACAVAVGYSLRSQFYGVHSTSLLVLAGAALFLLGPAVIAILVPATKAALLDPAQTMRRE